MALTEARAGGNLAPVASVWCRQVDNEAESPGYTTIPDDFPGRRETLETIRIVGNLTVNVADTHDYWDPDPAQPLSFYPNLFLYPAANGRYTCVGRMFLSTEDRPRLGMKTLVFETSELNASGDFGGAVLRAYGTMGAKPGSDRPTVEADPATLQAVGEGFLFHRGTTEPVVLVASDQWESAAQVVLDLVAALPSTLVSLGAFLVFPYFLPAAKVNLDEFTEQIPLALAVLRVPKGEAQGDRHTKRIQSWDAAPVTLRDLTKPPSGKSKETVPLILQYLRDHQDEKLREVARRVDLVEGTRVREHLQDADRQNGRDRRKEMWRIATAMETAAMLQTRPKGRGVAMSGEAAKRASEYLKAQPVSAPPPPPPPPSSPTPSSSVNTQLPAWLQRPPEVVVPTGPTPGVPVSTSDDPSLLPAVAPPPAPPGPAPAPAPVVAESDLEARLRAMIDERFSALGRGTPVAPGDAVPLDARVAAIGKEVESRWALQAENRARESDEATARALLALRTDLTSRLNAVEARPSASPDVIADEVTKRVRAAVEPRISEVEMHTAVTPEAVAEEVTARLRSTLEPRVVALESRPAPSPDSISAEVTKRTQAALEPRLTALEARPAPSADAIAADAAKRTQAALEPRLTAVEGRPILTLDVVAAEAAKRVQATSEPRLVALEGRPTLSKEALADEVTKKVQAGLEPRLQAVEMRPVLSKDAIAEEIAKRLRTTLEPRLIALESRPVLTQDAVVEEAMKRVRAALELRMAQLDDKVRVAVQGVSEAWAERLREELRRSSEEVGAHAAKAEEELRTALVAQIDLEVRELKEQGTALREEVEERVREMLQTRSQETEQRRVKEARDSEARLNLLIEGRTKDLEARVTAALADQRERTTAIANERVADAERRMAVEREARVAELAESQAQATAGLQVRLQSYFEQKLRENQEREREKYVELLARLKSEVDQSLARTIDSTRFDSAVRERVLQSLDAARPDQEKQFQTTIADAEVRLRTQAEEGAARLERTVRDQVGDLDRRLEVLTDRMLPLLRQTWLKVADLEKGKTLPDEAETRMKDLRREVSRELRRLEGEMIEQTTDLRERLETAIASQGRIWLNLLRQLSVEGEAIVPHPTSRSLRRAPKPSAEEELLATDFRAAGMSAYAEDPPNPMDPEPGLAPEDREPRRRPRRS